MSREKGGKSHQMEQMIEGGGCSKPLCQASTLIELTFMEAMERVMDAKFAKIEGRINDIDEKNDKIFRIITNEEYGKTSHMPHGKMDNRFTTLEETLDSVSESVIDKLIPAVIKMQKDVKTIRKDIDCITKQQEDENMRLYQSIHKMQDRLDETFLRASDTKQMGREIIKNTEDLLRGTTNKVDNSIEEQNGPEKREEIFDRSERRCNSPPRSPLDNTRRPRSPSPKRERHESEHYDPEEILSRSIQKEKNNDHSHKGNSNDPRRQESSERYRSRSSFSDRTVPNGERFNNVDGRRNSPVRKNQTPPIRREESPIRQKRPRTPPERPPSPDSNIRQPVSPDRNMANCRTPSPQRRMSGNERFSRPRREFSPLVTRYPSPQIERHPEPKRPRTPLSPGKIYTDNQESTEENGVFIDKFGEEKHWTRWTYSEPNVKRAKLAEEPLNEEDKLADAKRITVTVRRTPSGSPKRVRRASSSSEEGIIH